MKEPIRRYKNKSGNIRWLVDFQIRKKRIRKRDFYNKDEAVRYFEQIKYLILSGQYESYLEAEREEKKKVLLSDFAKGLYDSKTTAHMRASTRKQYKWRLIKSILPVLGHKPLGEINERDFYKVNEHLTERDLKVSTRTYTLQVLSTTLRLAKDKGLIDTVPKCPFKRPTVSRNIYLTDIEIQRVLNTLEKYRAPREEWLRVWVYLQLNTFTRLGELIALEWSDVDFDNKTITINKQYCDVSKALTPTKNNKIHMALPLSDEMMTMLKNYKDVCGDIKIIFPRVQYWSDSHKSKYRSMVNPPRISKTTIGYHFKKLACRAEVEPKRLTSHVLRKTAGDRLLRAGLTIQQVAYALRSNPEVILRTYSQVNEKVFSERLSDVRWLDNVNMMATKGLGENFKKDKSQSYQHLETIPEAPLKLCSEVSSISDD